MTDSEIKKRVEALLAQLPRGVAYLHRRIRALDKKASADATTNADARELRREAADLVGRLKAACNHLYLAGYDGYEGSYSHDCDDGYRGSRLCAVCGLRESGDDYKTLILRDEGLMLDVCQGRASSNHGALSSVASACARAKLADVLRRYVTGAPTGVRGVSEIREGDSRYLIRTPEFYRIIARFPRY